jgi:hypothetical protein
MWSLLYMFARDTRENTVRPRLDAGFLGLAYFLCRRTNCLLCGMGILYVPPIDYTTRHLQGSERKPVKVSLPSTAVFILATLTILSCIYETR